MKNYLWIIIIFLVVSTAIAILLNYPINISYRGVTKQVGSLVASFKPVKIPHKESNYTEPQFNAKAGILIDEESGYVLFEKNANEKLPIASTTKIATALVVLENHKNQLNDEVTITRNMINVIPSVISLRVGERITVNNLLHGLLIMSGNDAAYSLAEYFGGLESFVNEMNQKVKEIGVQDTHYNDPAGLDDEGYSTARDLAIIASYAQRNEIYSRIVVIPEETIYSVDGRISHPLLNSNRLIRPDELYYFPYSIGGKTGFTYEAGHVLVSTAVKDNTKLIAVVLNTNENTNSASAKESKKLLEWGFTNWSW